MFSITNADRHSLLGVPFSQMKNGIVGTRYDLSVVIVSPQKMRALNRKYRKKDASTDILAFPLSETGGEIFLSMNDVKRRAPDFGMTPRDYLAYLFIHGLIHLEGFDHGRTMEKLERKYCQAFGFPFP